MSNRVRFDSKVNLPYVTRVPPLSPFFPRPLRGSEGTSDQAGQELSQANQGTN